MVKKTKYGISFYGRLAQRSEQPAHNRSVLGSNPRASTTLFVKQVYYKRLPAETEFIFSVQPAQRRRCAKAGMRLAAALASNRSVLGSSPRASILFFGVTGRSIFCTTTLYNFCIPLLFHSVYCSACCSCFIIYKKQQ